MAEQKPTAEATWPEQDAVDAWLLREGLYASVSSADSLELKNAVTKPRLEAQAVLEQRAEAAEAALAAALNDANDLRHDMERLSNSLNAEVNESERLRERERGLAGSVVTPDAVDDTLGGALDALAEVGDGYSDPFTLVAIKADYRRLYEQLTGLRADEEAT